MTKINRCARMVVFLGMATHLRAEDVTINVSGTSIIIPAPEGFHRSDGKSPKYDAVQASLIPQGNRILASFCTDDDLAQIMLDKIPTPEINYHVSLMKSLVGRSISESSFGELKSTLRQRTSAPNPGLSAILHGIEDKASEVISSEVSENLRLKLSTPEFLGIFDETPSSVSISALSRFDFDLGQGNSMMGVTAASLSWIKIQNRVLAIYCTVPYQRKGDIDSTRKNILLWRDSILAANIEGLPTGSSKRAMSQLTTESKTGTRAASHLQNEDKMDWRKIIDKAIVGAFFGLCWVVMHGMKSLIKRRKKDQM